MATKPGLPLEARRLRMVIVTLPIMAATSYVLYKRLVLGEEQRKLPNNPDWQTINVRVVESDRENAF